MKIIRISEKSVKKMHEAAEMISEAAESFMECLDEMQGMGNREDEEEYDEEEYDEEDMEWGQEEMGQRSRDGSGYMGNRGGSGYMGMCCRNCGRQTLEQVKDTVVCNCCGASGPAL